MLLKNVLLELNFNLDSEASKSVNIVRNDNFQDQLEKVKTLAYINTISPGP